MRKKKVLIWLSMVVAVVSCSFLVNICGPQDVSAKKKKTSSSQSTAKDPGMGSKDGCVKTSIIGKNGEYCEDEKGDGVFEILAIVFNILTAGVGVLGVLGIVVAGIQYQTAAGNEAQMAKAKSRILQVVIGLAIYALLYVGLNFLLPGGLFNKA